MKLNIGIILPGDIITYWFKSPGDYPLSRTYEFKEKEPRVVTLPDGVIKAWVNGELVADLSGEE